MSNKSGIDVLTQDWVQKFHFENRVDLNLQAPAENESTKIEVNDIPIDLLPKMEFSLSSSTTTSGKSDSYLQSILSSTSTKSTTNTSCTGNQTCVCYKCQRQRRRAGLTRNTNDTNKSIDTINNNSKSNRVITEEKVLVSCAVSPTIKVAPITPQPTNVKRGNTVRKTPTLRSYEKHMPKPAYSQQDSIYRIELEEERRQDDNNRAKTINVTQQDNYKMAWKEDETGDDLLSSLVTFQTIFEEKGNGDEGLSDLLEQRTQELKYQKLREQEEATRPKNSQNDLPPRQSDCLTLSYRNGPKHNPLTLYHTMKMNKQQERMNAYSTAFKHCINSNSGLKDWIKKSRVAPVRESSKLIQTVRRPTIKRSLLHPLTSSRKNKISGEESMIWSTSTESLSVNITPGKKTIDMISSPLPLVQSNDNNQLTDVLSAAQALLPNQNLAQQQLNQKGNKIPYEHIDIPSRPRHTPPISQSPVDIKDNSSISSSESVPGTSSKLLKVRSGRLFSSLGRKTSMRTYNKPSSVRSLEKIDSGNESQSHEKVLDDLCRILPHIDRAQLSPYVYEANNDYMVALQLCKSAVISGKLS